MIRPNDVVARRMANELLDECAVSRAPVDPEWIVREKQLMFEESAGFPAQIYGALFRSGNDFGIVVSRACPGDGHRRFTIAHELGHYHIPGHVERLFPNPGDGNALSMAGHFRGRRDPIEVEADLFASELLMPERFVRPAMRSIGDGLAAVRAMADQFRTSLSSAAIRFASATGEPVAVILSHDNVIEWTAVSSALSSYRWARPSLRKEWAPPRSATYRLARAPERVRRQESDDDSMLLCEWFSNAPTSLEVVEEAVGLGMFGRVLTVLTAQGLSGIGDDGDEDAERDDGSTGDWRDALREYRMG